MATAKFIALKHHKKSDGKINLKLCVYHKSSRVYLSTNYTVVESQLKKDYTIKDSQKDLKANILADELKYLKKIGDLDWRLDAMTAKELGEHLLKPDETPITQVDFIKFSRGHIEWMKSKGRDGTAGCMQSVVNNLVDFLKTDIVYTSDITSKMLRRFEDYLSQPYTQVRQNKFNLATINRPPMADSSLFTYMNNLRTLFNAARDNYNDLDSGKIIIPNYPFKAYKPAPPKETEPRAVDIKTVIMIRDLRIAKAGSSTSLARDMFMLSFYMLGINAKDIYLLKGDHVDRINYNRSKTKDRRRDSAFISVKIIPEARVLLDRYAGKLQGNYSLKSFRNAILYGTGRLVELLGVEKFTFYSARHTVATEARNRLGFSVADIGESLNHRREESRITDPYIKKDWSKIDEIQSGVVALLNTV